MRGIVISDPDDADAVADAYLDFLECEIQRRPDLVVALTHADIAGLDALLALSTSRWTRIWETSAFREEAFRRGAVLSGAASAAGRSPSGGRPRFPLPFSS